MQAKVFGGAQVMASFNSINVGQRNTQFVFDYLATERISVVSQDVLDICPRKVCFFPKTGQAWVKRLAHSHPESVIAQDHRRRADAFAWEKTGGSVDLF
jgi:chemotaxis protein CheD